MTGERDYISPYIGRETYFLKGKNTPRVDNKVGDGCHLNTLPTSTAVCPPPVRCLALLRAIPGYFALAALAELLGNANERATASPTSTVPFARQSSWLLDNVTRRGMPSNLRGVCVNAFFDLFLRVRHARRLWVKAALAWPREHWSQNGHGFAKLS